MVPLEEQDRALWDPAAIAEGCAVLDAALRRHRPVPYQVQAAIAACHATAATVGGDRLAGDRIAVQAAERNGPLSHRRTKPGGGGSHGRRPDAGLWLVERLERSGALPGYHLLPATRADLLRRSGRLEEAQAAYREALALVGTDAERRYLLRRLRRDPGYSDNPRALVGRREASATLPAGRQYQPWPR